MPYLIIITCADMLGKVGKETLSQQTLMELFIEEITNKGKICGRTDHLQDISLWGGVGLDENLEVIEIDWERYFLEGSISLEWLPSTIHTLRLWKNAHLTGTIDLCKLPGRMKELDLSCNEFNGEICLTQLPDVMEYLNLSENRLEGSLNLRYLSPSMQRILLGRNCFCGEIDLQRLPEGLQELGLDHNFLEGETDFSHLPGTLKRLSIVSTNLEGTIYVSHKQDMKLFKARESNVQVVVR